MLCIVLWPQKSGLLFSLIRMFKFQFQFQEIIKKIRIRNSHPVPEASCILCGVEKYCPWKGLAATNKQTNFYDCLIYLFFCLVAVCLQKFIIRATDNHIIAGLQKQCKVSQKFRLTWLFSQLSWFSTWKLVVSRITRDTLARSSSRTKYILKQTAFYKFRWIVVTWIGPSQAALLLPAFGPNRSGGTHGRARQTLTSSLVFLLGKVKIMFLSDMHKR